MQGTQNAIRQLKKKWLGNDLLEILITSKQIEQKYFQVQPILILM